MEGVNTVAFYIFFLFLLLLHSLRPRVLSGYGYGVAMAI